MPNYCAKRPQAKALGRSSGLQARKDPIMTYILGPGSPFWIPP